MKHRTKILSTLGVIAGVAIAGFSMTSIAHSEYHQKFSGHEIAERGDHGKRHKGKSAMKMLSHYDENGDRAITLSEVMTARGKQFSKFDVNNDGTLDLSEFKGLWMAEMRYRMVDRFQDHDSDGDGKINAEDFSAKVAHMIERMDRNQDGKVDRSDMKRHKKDSD